MAGEHPVGNVEDKSPLGDYFDRVKRALDKKPGTTVSNMKPIDAKTLFFDLSQQWTVQTVRLKDVAGIDKKSKDTIFLTFLSRDGSMRIVIPHEVADAIASQREYLTKKGIKSAAKDRAAALKARGWKPTFKKKNKAEA
jgi:hypothetical protein